MELKDRIIDESLKLFSVKGFAGTSMNDILKAAKTSKGGFYNHFKSKEHLFHAVLEAAGSFWREKNLAGLQDLESPVSRLKKLLENYRDRYLKDSENLPGGCVFAALAVELDDRQPQLTKELHEGFARLRSFIARHLREGKTSGELREQVDVESTTELIFACMIGASVVYGTEKSGETLDRSIGTLMAYLDALSP
jgi:TetR/AcrR family transcriptional repressor of nem operon